MSNSRKALLGVLSFLPAISMVAWFVYLLSNWRQMMLLSLHPDAAPERFLQQFFHNLIMGLILMVPGLITSVVLIIVYILHILKRKTGGEQVVWILAVLLAGTIAFPLYWCMNIRKEPGASAQLPI